MLFVVARAGPSRHDFALYHLDDSIAASSYPVRHALACYLSLPKNEHTRHKMSLKQELQTWSDALQAYEREDYDASLALFASIAESSRIHFNIGIIYATLGSLPVVTQAISQSSDRYRLNRSTRASDCILRRSFLARPILGNRLLSIRRLSLSLDALRGSSERL